MRITERLREVLTNYFEVMLRSEGGRMQAQSTRLHYARLHADELQNELAARGLAIVDAGEPFETVTGSEGHVLTRDSSPAPA